MKGIRRFTNSDWYAYAGAEEFRDHSSPFIYNAKMENDSVEIVILADVNGIELDIISQGEDDLSAEAWSKIMELSPLTAMGEMHHLVEFVNKFDHAYELAYALNHGSDECVDGFEYMGNF